VIFTRLRSSMEQEHPASNRGVAGSSPAGGAICPRSSEDPERCAPNAEVGGSSPPVGTSILDGKMEIEAGRLRTKMLMSRDTWERLKPGRLKRTEA